MIFSSLFSPFITKKSHFYLFSQLKIMKWRIYHLVWTKQKEKQKKRKNKDLILLSPALSTFFLFTTFSFPLHVTTAKYSLLFPYSFWPPFAFLGRVVIHTEDTYTEEGTWGFFFFYNTSGSHIICEHFKIFCHFFVQSTWVLMDFLKDELHPPSQDAVLSTLDLIKVRMQL